MDKSKSASSGFFKILEKVIRSHPLLYYVARYFIRFTNIFEDDAHGVVLLNFKNIFRNIIFTNLEMVIILIISINNIIL